MLTDFDMALVFGVITTIGVSFVAALILAVRQYEDEQTTQQTCHRLTLDWVWQGLVEPEPWPQEESAPPAWWAGEPTQCWPMVLELRDTKPEPPDVPARTRFPSPIAVSINLGELGVRTAVLR